MNMKGTANQTEMRQSTPQSELSASLFSHSDLVEPLELLRETNMTTEKYWTCVCEAWHCISLGLIQNVPTRWLLAFSLVFLHFLPNAPKYCSFGGGGGYVYTF